MSYSGRRRVEIPASNSGFLLQLVRKRTQPVQAEVKTCQKLVVADENELPNLERALKNDQL